MDSADSWINGELKPPSRREQIHADRSEPVRHPAFRFGLAAVFAAPLGRFAAGVTLPPDFMLARSASIRL